MSLTKIGSIGINTGIAFAGVTTIVTLNTANDALSIGATVNVGSGITLGASGDIFATGVSTFSGNLKVGSGVTISPDGDGFYTGVVTATTFSGALAASSLTGALPAISGANLTNLDASDLASGTVPTARLGSGTASSSTFLRGDSTFQTVVTDLVNDTSPQLGGDLASNGRDILMADSDQIKLGAGNDLLLYHNGSDSFVAHVLGSGHMRVAGDSLKLMSNAGDENYLVATKDGAVELYHDNSKRIETKGAGANFYGDTGDHTVVTIYGSEGRDADLELFADDGDDNADKWRILASTDASFYLQNYTSGSWEFNLKATGNGAVELYHDNSKKLETSAAGIKLNGADSNGAQFQLGAGNDFQIEHDGSNSYIYNLTNDLVIQNDASVKITAKSGGTQRFRFDSDGIKFGTDSAAANALDDYEEGTFIPSFTCSSGSIAPNPSYNNLAYTKIGRVVHVTGQLVLSNASSPSGNLDFVGLPFAGHSGTQISERAYNIQLGYFNGSGKPANNHYSFVLRIDGSGATTARMEGIDAHEDGSIADWTGNGTDLWFCFTYFTDS